MRNIFDSSFKKIAWGLMTFVALAASACSDDESYTFSGDDGKVYIKIQNSFTVNAKPNICDFKVSKTLWGTFGEASVEFPIHATMPVKGTVKASIDSDMSLVDAYNATNHTEYKALDANMITFSTKELTITEGNMTSDNSVEIAMAQENLSALEIGEYLFPIKLVNVEGGMEASSNWSVAYIKISVIDDPYGLPKTDRNGWSVVDCSTEETVGENAPASNVLDGNINTIWHSKWYAGEAKPPHHITIDMGAEQNLIGVQYRTRSSGRGCPRELTVEVSTDNVSWSTAKAYVDVEVGNNIEVKLFFDEPVRAKYFRLYITKCARNYWGGVYNDNYACLSEVNGYVVNL